MPGHGSLGVRTIGASQRRFGCMGENPNGYLNTLLHRFPFIHDRFQIEVGHASSGLVAHQSHAC